MVQSQTILQMNPSFLLNPHRGTNQTLNSLYLVETLAKPSLHFPILISTLTLKEGRQQHPKAIVRSKPPDAQGLL